MTIETSDVEEGLKAAIELLEAQLTRRRPCVVGIFGASQAGKTHVAQALTERLKGRGQSVFTLAMTDYYRTKSDLAALDNRHLPNFDQPKAVDLAALAADLKAIRAGHEIDARHVVFEQDPESTGFPRTRTTIAGQISGAGTDVVIAEGLFIHHDPVRSEIDLLIYCDQPDGQKRLAKRLHRDVFERGFDEHTVRDRWTRQVEPGYRAYIAPPGYRARFRTDLVIKNPY